MWIDAQSKLQLKKGTLVAISKILLRVSERARDRGPCRVEEENTTRTAAAEELVEQLVALGRWEFPGAPREERILDRESAKASSGVWWGKDLKVCI